MDIEDVEILINIQKTIKGKKRKSKNIPQKNNPKIGRSEKLKPPSRMGTYLFDSSSIGGLMRSES